MTSGQYWDDEGANYDGRQTIKMTTNEIEVPIHIGGAYDASSDVRLFAEVGPYLSYAISGSKKTTGFFTDYDDIHSSGITENICHVKKRILAKPCVITTAKNGTLPLRDSHKSLT